MEDEDTGFNWSGLITGGLDVYLDHARAENAQDMMYAERSYRSGGSNPRYITGPDGKTVRVGESSGINIGGMMVPPVLLLALAAVAVFMLARK